MSIEPEVQTAAEVFVEETKESNTLKVIGWLSVGLVVAAVGFFVGRELLSRYKFNHRDPYDFYTHAGEKQTGEFGLGV
ncbi:MAG: hypothetical protein ACLPXT_12695 [Terracidiphilus sp.]